MALLIGKLEYYFMLYGSKTDHSNLKQKRKAHT